MIKGAGGGEGTKGGIQYSRWTWHAWKKFAWKGKKGRKGGKKGSTCRGPPFLFLRGRARSLIKLNRNLISMGNVSTNRVGKDLCEWGGRDYIALLDDARLMGRRLMERDEEGRREAIIATELDGLFFFFLVGEKKKLRSFGKK